MNDMFDEAPDPSSQSATSHISDIQFHLDDAAAAYSLWASGDVPDEAVAVASLRDVIEAAEAAIEQIRSDAVSVRTAHREMNRRAFEQIIAAWGGPR